ncbi:hypothetical protein DKX38_025715 [Salix brachista]|uniref:Bystin n=1 Tax=Salix brachista TaxID=2182728 RepID=A0A5N5JRM6_9ROSI|nr:hypothetical protein DKX38_025715 [Salix brachista]
MGKKRERHRNPELFLPEVSDSIAPSTKTRCKASKHHQKQQKVVRMNIASLVLTDALVCCYPLLLPYFPVFVEILNAILELKLQFLIQFTPFLLLDMQSGPWTLREAVIVGSIIQKVSIPMLHSCYFMKLLLDKKYALPYRVLDAVVAHFMTFLEDTRIMPVIWQQSLLSFVQRYKNELQKEDKDNLRRLVLRMKHKLVSPEIIRELDNSRNRGEKDDPMSLNIICMQN